MPASALSTGSRRRAREPGSAGEYYRRPLRRRARLHARRRDGRLRLGGRRAPDAAIDDDGFSVRWTGELVAPGDRPLHARHALRDTRAASSLDGQPLAQGRSDHEPADHRRRDDARAPASRYPIRLELRPRRSTTRSRSSLWQAPGGRRRRGREAVAARAAADAVVLVLGLSSRLEGEEMPVRDRGLRRRRPHEPRPARRCSRRSSRRSWRPPRASRSCWCCSTAARSRSTGPTGTSPRSSRPGTPARPAGTAVADVLFGDVSPAGRLPVTFYRSVDQLPPFDDYAMKGRTYRYFDGRAALPLRPRPELLALRLREARACRRRPRSARRCRCRSRCANAGADGGGRGRAALRDRPRGLGAGAAARAQGLPARLAQAGREARSSASRSTSARFSLIGADGQRSSSPDGSRSRWAASSRVSRARPTPRRRWS